MLPSPGRPMRRPRSRRKRPPFRRFPSSAGHFRHRRWMPSSLSFLLLALLLLFSPGNAQFGEIASVITSLLASGGGGAGLAGLSGLGAAGSGAGLAASAGSGAAGAAGSIGSLYQLAQAALQLTGTGVGIANQASESAWFPVVVENAAKMNKDFQERLLSGGALGPTGAGASGSKTSSSKSIGTEYGKEFGSGEETVVGIGENSLASRGGSGTDGGAGSSAIFPARGSSLGLGLPDLLPMPGRPMLPGLARLLPGESGPGTSVETGAGGQTISTGKKLVGIGTVEEVPLSPPLAGTEPEATAVLLPGEGGPSAGPDQQPQLPLLPDVSSELPPPAAPPPPPPAHFLPFPAISSPKITVKLPQSVDSEGEKELPQNKKAKEAAATIEQIETEFSTDTEQQRKAAAGEEPPSLNGTGQPEERERSEKERDEEVEAEGEDVDTAGLEPLIPSGPTAELQALNMTHIERFAAEHRGLTQMVPELRKLIGQLQMGNLTATELDELEAQLAGNAEAGEPRENTEPPPTSQSAAASAETRSSAESGRRPKGGRQRTPKVRNEKREQASHRNLEALRRGLHSSSDASEEEELVDGQQDPILRKIVDFNRPPVILSLERPSPGHRGTLLPGRRLSSHRVESSDDDGGRDQEQKQQQQQRRGLSRAFGTQLEAVEEQQPTEEGGEEDGGEPATTTGGSDTTDSTATKTTTRITRTSPTTTATTSTTILAATPIRAKIPVLASTQTKPSHHGGRLNGQQGTKPATTEKNATVATALRQKTSHQPQPALPVVDAAVEGTGSQQRRPQWPRPLPIVGQPTITTTSRTPNQHGNQQQFQQQRGNNAQWQRPQHWQQQQGQQQHNPAQFGQQQQPRPQLPLQHQQPQFGHYTQQQQWLGNNQPQQQQPQWRWGQQQPQAQQQGWAGQQQWGQQPQQHQPQQQHQQWVHPQQPQHQEQKPSFQQSQFSPAHAQQPLPWRTVPDPAPVGSSPGLVYHPFSSGQLLTLNQPQQQQQADFFRFGRK